MRDWQELVRRHLSGLALDAGERDEVHAELAAHLEDSHEEFCRKGLSETEAVRRTMEQVADWRDLQREIFAAKRRGDLMQKRVQQLWIPGFLTLMLSTLFLMTLQKAFGVQPRIVGDDSGPGAILFYVPWLAALPFCGALGAYLSSRAGGSRGNVLLASIFPSLALATAFLLMFPIGMMVEWVTRHDLSFEVVAIALLSNWIGWIVVPGVALFLGGLVVSVLSRRRLSSQSTLIGSETTHA